jgi:hypothetical protein
MRLTIGIALASVVAGAVPARADLVYFASGRYLSVKSHRIDGDLVVLTLRAGGEIVCDRALVNRIEPDEIPYPADVDDEDREAAVPDLPAPAPSDPGLNALIESASARYGVDPNLVRAVIEVESAYRPRARSRRGAMGLMQLMPHTARLYALSNPYDPAANIDAGTRHLSALLARFDLPRALAAYNAGEAAVERFGGIPPYPETRSYVARVLKLVGF